MVAELIDKYIWLIQTLVDAGERGLSLGSISAKWERRYGTAYARRSFNNHREAIADIFGISIECDRSTNCYFIPGGRDSIDSDRAKGWLIDSFTVGNMLAMGKESLPGRISVEKIPSGRNNLTPLMAAMTAGKVVEISYRKYSGTEYDSLHVAPYALKEQQKRWYLVGFCKERNAIRVYGLDRILKVVQTEDGFAMPQGFDVDELFSESFGMYLSDGKDVRTITFRTDSVQARYLRDLPLHESQFEVGTGADGSVTFALRVAVNEALLMELTRLGDKIEILAPDSLRATMKEIFEKASKIYL